MRREVVLDKSYLQGASRGAIQDLCGTYRVLMPAELFFELLTCDPVERARCFAKLPSVMNPVEIVEHVGRLLRFEARRRKPASPLYQRRLRILFSFNDKLMDRDFVPTPEQQEGIKEWGKDIERQVGAFRARVAHTYRWFPEIEAASNRDRPGVIERIQESIATDHKLVRKLYSRVRTRPFPKAAQLDSRWAFFRWIQVQILSALDYTCRYRIGSDLTGARALENEVSDFQYRIMGVLAGAIATRDKKCQQVFQMLRPGGLIIS